jgi:hypothetical protein
MGPWMLRLTTGELLPRRPGDSRDIDSGVGPEAAALGGHSARITASAVLVHVLLQNSSSVRGVLPRFHPSPDARPGVLETSEQRIMINPS